MADGRLLAALVLLLCLGCAGPGAKHRYKLYPGPARQANELAILQLGRLVSSLRVDGMRVERADYGSVALLPGDYEITWGAQFLVSGLVNQAGRDAMTTNVTVALRAGHVYSAHADRTTGHGYRMYLWIEDADTLEVVGGTKIP